jgi:uncharacterized protein (DUF1330 family)
MVKGYWIAQIDVHDMDAYKPYQAAAAAALARFGGRYLIRGGTREVVEGIARSRTVVIEFPTYQAALDCYRSAEYQKALPGRTDLAISDFVIIEGYDGPQP